MSRVRVNKTKLNLKWEVIVFYEGFSTDLDDRIEQAARKYSDGSGYGGFTRDLSFTFRYRKSALQAAKRIRDLRTKSNRLTASVFDSSEENE